MGKPYQKPKFKDTVNAGLELSLSRSKAERTVNLRVHKTIYWKDYVPFLPCKFRTVWTDNLFEK